MSKCGCSSEKKLVSEAVKKMNFEYGRCRDVCAHPICKDPCLLGIMAPLIYDEIGVNLCTTFEFPITVSQRFPGAKSATVQVIGMTFEYGTTPGTVSINPIPERHNCYEVVLSNITVQFMINIYDENCSLLTQVYQTNTYLPYSAANPDSGEETNPSSLTLQIFAPYGFSNVTPQEDVTPTPVINVVGFTQANDYVKQGVNLFGMAKVLGTNFSTNTLTVGLTLVLQSLYFVGYKVKSAGKIDIPKGSIVTPEDTDCMKFVEGDLLNIKIKPLDLGFPEYEEYDKQDCDDKSCDDCENRVFDKIE